MTKEPVDIYRAALEQIRNFYREGSPARMLAQQALDAGGMLEAPSPHPWRCSICSCNPETLYCSCACHPD